MIQPSRDLVTPTLGEVESAFAELDEAIIGHSKWLIEWNTRIICGIPVEQKYISRESYRECYFGRWYYAQHANFLLQYPSFIAIDQLHRTVHNQMIAIVTKANRGDLVARNDYESFVAAEAALSEAIVSLRDGLYELLLSFDHLTGALNRQAFFHLLEQEYARVVRFDEPGCVVLLDIDHFKQVNDQFGHAAGDKALVAVANYIISNIRPYDSVCRYGGEEFLVCMPKTTLDAAYGITDRIRDGLSQQQIGLPHDEAVQITASFGIALMSKDDSLKDIVEHADTALYQAKEGGRNRVCVWGQAA